MNLYHIKLTDDQKDALERLFNMGIVWSKTELSEAWEQLREQLKDAVQCEAIINAIQDSGCNCKKPIEPAPKYDPCRPFRKGDKVWEVLVKGRRCLGGHNNHKAGELATVTCNEYNGTVIIQYEDGDKLFIDVAYLELVAPGEEIEPYYIEKHGEKPGGLCYTVHKHGGVRRIFILLRDLSHKRRKPSQSRRRSRARPTESWHRKEQGKR